VPIEQVVTVELPSGGAVAVWDALSTAGHSLTGATRVVVLRGESADLADRGATGGVPDEPPTAAIEWLGRPDVITIASLRAPAAGAALDAALACDLRIVADDAQLSPSGSIGGIARLGELMGYSRALGFVVTGAAISGLQAAQSGLANLSVESRMLDAAVAEMVATVLRTPREVTTVAKAVLREAAADRSRRAGDLLAGIRLAANEP
jgi:enoyl-CoA hydratase/carnithine racemase